MSASFLLAATERAAVLSARYRAPPSVTSMLLPASSPLPKLAADEGFSILTYNVLIPNSNDGWWCYKYYGPSVPVEKTTWAHRQALLKSQILGSGADIVALQETSDIDGSFESDWSFMAEAGYDYQLYKSGRMRPATFYKRDRWALCQVDGSPVVSPEEGKELPKGADGVLQGDRTLTTILRPRGADGAPVAVPVFVINAHLSAGPEARRRLRQVHETLELIRKLRAKAKLPEQGTCCVLVGDFNSQGHSGVRELLVAGEVRPEFRESGDATELHQHENEVTSKAKRQSLGPFGDALGAACAQAGVARPPTIVAAQLQPAMQNADGTISAALVAALDEAFDALSSDGATLSDDEQARWLTRINLQVGRGSEYRFALAARESHGGTPMTRADFHALYAAEVAQGKFWGVEHDLRAMRPGGAGLRAPGSPPFSADFDYVWFSSNALRLVGAQAPLPDDTMAELLSGALHGLPDEANPSDHLPVAAAFAFEPPP